MTKRKPSAPSNGKKKAPHLFQGKTIDSPSGQRGISLGRDEQGYFLIQGWKREGGLLIRTSMLLTPGAGRALRDLFADEAAYPQDYRPAK